MTRQANRWKDLATGALISVLIHGGAGYGIVRTGILQAGELTPAMQQGRSGLAITLLPSHLMLKTDQHDSELAIVLTQPDAEVIKNVEQPKDEPESPPTSQDADTLTKGVESVPKHASNLRIRYPLGSKIRGEEGKVVVRVTVDASGRVRSLTITESSGYPALDRQALKDLRRARYYPATDGDGRPRAGEVTVPVIFRLKD